MGCDGGTIPTRGELVRTKKKPEQISKQVDLLVKWEHCAISQEPLRTPIVACELGHLFNKESVIEFLLDKSSHETANKFEYIRGLKDFKELQLSENPAYTVAKETTKSGEDRKMSPYICPITGLEMNGRYRFCYLLGCGCTFAERALNEINDATCVKCGLAYTPDDVIPINGTDEEMVELRSKMDERRLKAKELRKCKKEKSQSVSAAAGSAASAKISEEKESSNKVKNEDDSGLAPQQSCTKESCADKAVPTTTRSELLPSRKRKLDESVAVRENLKSAEIVTKEKQSKDDKSALISKSNVLSKIKESSSQSNGEQTKKFKSIQKDPNASAAYKSLFSSCEAAKNQPKAHWVTHNPLFY